jgi:membrane protein implicated in regulation of membrane protease activity
MLLRTVLLMFAALVVCMGVVGLVLTHWTVGLLVIVAAAVVALAVWALFGTGRRSPVEPDATDADLEREKSIQNYVRTTRIPPR